MKKLLMIAVFSACAFASNAQDNGGGKKLSFSAGLELSLPTGDWADLIGIGFGATAQGAYALSDKAGITLNSGYITYSGKDGGGSFNVIPVMAGFKYGITEKFYGHGQAGMSFTTSEGESKSYFTWALGVGYNITSNIDVSLRYNSIGVEEIPLNTMGLRVAYTF